MLSIFRNLSLRNKILITATLIMLLVAVPLTILQSLNQQNTKQRASTSFLGFSVMLTPSSSTENIADDIDVDIHLLNSQRKEIIAVDINYGGYNQSMFESVVFQPSKEFQEIINKNQRYVGISPLEFHKNDVDIKLGTLKFVKSKNIGTVFLNLYNIRINVAGIRNAIVFDNISGQYTIVNPKTSSGTGGSTRGGGVIGVFPTPTNTPTPTPTITISPTATSASSLIPTPTPVNSAYNNCVNICLRNAAADPETFSDSGYACIQECKAQYGQ